MYKNYFIRACMGTNHKVFQETKDATGRKQIYLKVPLHVVFSNRISNGDQL